MSFFFPKKARRVFAAGFSLLVGFSLVAAAPCALAKPQTPRQLVWSLGFSSLDEAPLDANTLRAQLRDFQTLDVLAASKREVSLIVPVFEGGQTLFETATAPFAARNPQALSDEILLRAFVQNAKRRKMSVFFAFDVLGWGRAPKNGWSDDAKPSIFDSHPEWEEFNSALGSTDAVRFASPFNAKVRVALEDLVAETATKFPEADGAVFDVHLHRGEVSGFGSSARIAARRELGFDPTTLGIQGTADENLSENALRFLKWREENLGQLAQDLAQRWRAHHPQSQVWLSGVANYGEIPHFDALRSGQNARLWLEKQPRVFDALLLEGRFASGETARLADFAPQIPLKPLAVPDVSGKNAALEWGAISSKFDLPFGVVVSDASVGTQTLGWLSGKIAPPAPQPLRLHEMLPDAEFLDANGEIWSWKKARGQNDLLVLAQGHTKKSAKAWNALSRQFAEISTLLLASGVQFVQISPSKQRVNESPNVLNLQDAGREFLGRLPAQNSVVFVDRAGFVREVKIIQNAQELGSYVRGAGASERLEVGSLAPLWTVRDMNGQTRNLAALRGKKALLLSFFPKCFTGGCANHMASLSAQFELFEKNDIEVLGVSIDTPYVQREFAQRWKLRFALVPDEGRQLSLLYGAANTPDDLAQRKTVFIDKSGVVQWIDSDVRVASHGVDVARRLSLIP